MQVFFVFLSFIRNVLSSILDSISSSQNVTKRIEKIGKRTGQIPTFLRLAIETWFCRRGFDLVFGIRQFLGYVIFHFSFQGSFFLFDCCSFLFIYLFHFSFFIYIFHFSFNYHFNLLILQIPYYSFTFQCQQLRDSNPGPVSISFA